MEQETFKRISKQHSRVGTHISDKVTAEKQLADSVKQPAALHNLQDARKNEKIQGVDEII
jgi:hypothetical protein